MAGRIITITSGKGGVGKTTTTGNLGIALARLGKRVVCLDLDIGLRNLDLVLGLENRVVYNIVDVVEGRVRLEQALIRDRRLPNLFLLPASQWREKNAVNAKQATQLGKDLSVEYDYVLIDSPAGIEEGFRNAIAPADRILLVTLLEMTAVQDADRVIALAQAAGKPPPQIVVNRVRKHAIRRGDAPEAFRVIDHLGVELIGIVPEDESVIAQTNVGKPVSFSSRSPAGKAFSRIARRVNGESVPVPQYGESAGRFQWLTGLFR